MYCLLISESVSTARSLIHSEFGLATKVRCECLTFLFIYEVKKWFDSERLY